MLADDGVGAGGIDDVQLAQERERVGVDGEALVYHGFAYFGSPLHQGDARGGGGDAFGQDALLAGAQQGIHEGGLAGVEFAYDDEEEELVELEDGLLEGGDGLARDVEAGQGLADIGQGFFFFAQEARLGVG